MLHPSAGMLMFVHAEGWGAAVSKRTEVPMQGGSWGWGQGIGEDIEMLEAPMLA